MTGPCLLGLALLASARLGAAEISVNTIQFPEKKEIDVPFYALPPAPSGASLEAEVEARGNQTTIELRFEHLQPALLLGGEVNSYVLWAITRDGVAENLGEVFDRTDHGKNKFQSAQKEFGMIVTAEIVPGVPRPSALIVFQSAATKSSYAHNSAFPYSNFRPAPAHDVESIGTLHYTQNVPLELYQAQRVYDLGMAKGIDKYDAKSMSEAKIALAQATNSTQRGGSDKSVTDYSRRTVSLVTAAGRTWARALQAQEAAAAEAKRQEELNALKAQSEKLAAEKAAAQEVAVQAQMARQEAEKTALESETARKAAEARTTQAEESAKAADAARLKSEDLKRQAEEQADAAEKARLQSEADAAALEAQRDELAAERDRVQKDRDALSQRLTAALQGVATTRSTARGVVVSLPGILFDLNKSTLKPQAQIGLAKMAGVLSVFPDMNLRVEGYTDSTGTDEINLPLSRDRAESVAAFLKQQGVSPARIQTQGYGAQFPVASNATTEGRAENRRVEVVVAEGVVAAPGS